MTTIDHVDPSDGWIEGQLTRRFLNSSTAVPVCLATNALGPIP